MDNVGGVRNPFSVLVDAKLPQVEEYTEGIQRSKTLIFTSLLSREFLSHL